MAFRTVTDVDNAVNGLYDLMSGSGYSGLLCLPMET